MHRHVKSHPEVEGEDSKRSCKNLQVAILQWTQHDTTCSFARTCFEQLPSGVLAARERSRRRASPASSSSRGRPRAVDVARRASSSREERRDESFAHLARPTVPRTATSEETTATCSPRAVVGREPLDAACRRPALAHLERAAALVRAVPVEDERPRERPCRRRSSASRSRSSLAASRSRRRAGGCSRRRDRASAQPPRCRRAS